MSTTHDPRIDFDHHSPDFGSEAPERFEQLRARCPMGFTEAHGGYWVASTFEYAKRVLSETEHFTVERGPDGKGGKLIPAAPQAPAIVPGILDGEAHDRLRDPLRRLFSKGPIEASAGPIAQRVAGELLEPLVARDAFDFAGEFSFRLTVGTIFGFVGLVEIDDKPAFIEMLENAFAIDPEAGAARNELALATAGPFEAAKDRVRAVVRARAAAPTGDLISHMVAPETGLTEDDIVDLTLSIVLGGVRTTAASLDNIVWHLDGDHDLRRRLIEDPSLIPTAVNELIRLYSVTPLVARTALADVEFGDVVIREGDRVAALLASADLDETRFADPQQVDLARRDGLHLAFGNGTHYCLGIWLAKMELRVGLETVLRLMPDYEVVRDESRRYDLVGVNNGFAKLTVRPNSRPSSP